jgi:hypothetical protein
VGIGVAIMVVLVGVDRKVVKLVGKQWVQEQAGR